MRREAGLHCEDRILAKGRGLLDIYLYWERNFPGRSENGEKEEEYPGYFLDVAISKRQ